MLRKRLILVLLPLLALAACTKPPADSADPSNAGAPPGQSSRPVVSQQESNPKPTTSDRQDKPQLNSPAANDATKVLMHNVILNQKGGLKLSVRWLRGEMHPARAQVIPSFDDPRSFYLDVQDGVVGTKLEDVAGLLNSGLLKGSPLENVSLSAEGSQLKLNGTLHKGIPLPVEMISDVGAAPDGRILLHVAKLRVLKLPVTGLLRSLHVDVLDMVSPKGASGVQVSGNDIYLAPDRILPPPAIRGRLTDVHIGKDGELVSVFGLARPDVIRVKEWRNFIRLRGGVVNFGKITMDPADLFLIDSSDDQWFNFNLSRYQEQLVNGHIQMTAQAGLRVFMPDIDKIPATPANRNISLEWMKNRKVALPPDALQ